MYDNWLRKLLRKAIEGGVIGGLFMMNLAPEAQRLMEKDGLPTNSDQELRTLLVQHFGKDYLIVIIDAKDGRWYAGFFENTGPVTYYQRCR